MNVVRKKAPRIDFTKTAEPEPEPEPEPDEHSEVVEVKEETPLPKEEGNSVTKTVAEVEPKDEQPPPKPAGEEDIFNMGATTQIPPSKKKKKKVLSQKQLDHLARCREKALAKKKAMRQAKEAEKAERQRVRDENRAIKEAKAKKKKEDDALIRANQAREKKNKQREDMFEVLDAWYERKQKRKQASRAKKTEVKKQPPKAPTASGIVPKPKPTASGIAPQPQAQATAPMKFRNEWKDPYCSSKFSPFNPTFTRKQSRRGYMNY